MQSTVPSFPPGTPRYEPLHEPSTYCSPGISQMNNLLPSQDSATQRLAAIDREIRADITRPATNLNNAHAKLPSITALLDNLNTRQFHAPVAYHSSTSKDGFKVGETAALRGHSYPHFR
jgi:hypothetical protein